MNIQWRNIVKTVFECIKALLERIEDEIIVMGIEMIVEHFEVDESSDANNK